MNVDSVRTVPILHNAEPPLGRRARRKCVRSSIGLSNNCRIICRNSSSERSGIEGAALLSLVVAARFDFVSCGFDDM